MKKQNTCILKAQGKISELLLNAFLEDQKRIWHAGRHRWTDVRAE